MEEPTRTERRRRRSRDGRRRNETNEDDGESRARSSQTQRQPPPHSKAERIDQRDEPRKRTQNAERTVRTPTNLVFSIQHNSRYVELWNFQRRKPPGLGFSTSLPNPSSSASQSRSSSLLSCFVHRFARGQSSASIFVEAHSPTVHRSGMMCARFLSGTIIPIKLHQPPHASP